MAPRLARLVSVALAGPITGAIAAACAGRSGVAGPPPVATAPSSAPAPLGGAFVVRMGVDTTVVERFARTGNVYLSHAVVHSPRVALYGTRVELTPAGELARVTRTEHRIGAALDAPPLTRLVATVKGDSATVVESRGDSTVSTRQVAAPRGAVPGLEGYLPLELAAIRARAMSAAGTARAAGATPAAGLRVPKLLMVVTAPEVRVGLVGSDSMTIAPGPNLTFRARVDGAGRILGFHALGSTIQVRATREPTADVEAIAARWAQAPATGPLSPTDSVKTRVGDAAVAIHYGRPSKRGRVVFGDSGVAMEPWGKVWRTGANEATRLTTDRDLVIGDAVVPAGTYTLWTLLDRTGWRLIVNKQTLRADGTGRPLWGTGYDARQDLARTAMTMTRLSAPVEQMTILLEPQGPGAVLRVRWDTTEASVPIRPQ